MFRLVPWKKGRRVRMKLDKALIKEWIEDVEYTDWKDTDEIRTYCRLTLKNGYRLIGTSVCFDPSDYDNELGKFYAFEDAMRYLRVIHGFVEHELLSKEQ
jgi:uncharacterized metal-binding protein